MTNLHKSKFVRERFKKLLDRPDCYIYSVILDRYWGEIPRLGHPIEHSDRWWYVKGKFEPSFIKPSLKRTKFERIKWRKSWFKRKFSFIFY